MRHYDDRVVENWQTSNVNSTVKIVSDERSDSDEIELKITFALHFRAFFQSIFRNILNSFVIAVDGFKDTKVYYADTDSLYIKNTSYQFWRKKIDRDRNGSRKNWLR